MKWRKYESEVSNDRKEEENINNRRNNENGNISKISAWQ